jgi:hypothetical protein
MKFAHVSAYSFGRDRKGIISILTGGLLEKTDRLFTPGPGTYSPGTTKRSSPQWK